MGNVVDFNSKVKKLNDYILMHIQHKGFNGDRSTAVGLMVIGFKVVDGNIELIKPSRLDFSNESVLGSSRINPFLLDNFIDPTLTREEVLSVPPVWGNLTFDKYKETDVQLDEMTILQLHGTNQDMLAYLIDAPKVDEDIYISVIDFEIPVELHKKGESEDGYVDYEAYMNLETFDFEVTNVQSIIRAEYNEDGNVIPRVKNNVPQLMNFMDNITELKEKNVPKELHELLNTALKMYFTTSESTLNGQLKDMFRVFEQGLRGNKQLSRFRASQK